MEQMCDTYLELRSNRKPQGCVYDTADGYIISLIERGYSERELKAWLGIGGYMYNRIKQEMADSTLREKKFAPQTPSHAVTDEDIQNIKDSVRIWDSHLEDGFACSHRRQQRFFTSNQSEGVERITWTSLYKEYQNFMEEKNTRILSHSRWRQSVNFFFPEIFSTHQKSDTSSQAS
jgi:hypothetical protein